jgi:hypothetical protein
MTITQDRPTRTRWGSGSGHPRSGGGHPRTVACPHCGETINEADLWREGKAQRRAALRETLVRLIDAQPGIVQQRLIEATRSHYATGIFREVIAALVAEGRIRVERPTRGGTIRHYPAGGPDE